MATQAPPRPATPEPPRPPRRRPNRFHLIAAVVALVVGGLWTLAFVRAGDGDAPLPARPATPTTVAPALNPAAAAEAAYRSFWAAFAAYGTGTDAFDPVTFARVFAPLSTGAEYERLFGYFQTLRLRGQVLRGGGGDADLAPRVTLTGIGRAEVRDCMADTGGVYDVATGTRLDTPTEGREVWTATLVVEGGRWKVADVVGTGEACVP